MTTALVVIEGVVIVLLAVLVAGLLKSHAEILRQLAALGATEDGAIPASTRANRPPSSGLEKVPTETLEGVDDTGAKVTLSLVHGRGNTLVAFLSSTCLSCETFWKEFGGPFELPTPDTRTVIVTKGPESESPARVAALAPDGLPLVMSDDMWDTFRVPMTPYFLLVNGEGRILGEGAASNWRHLLGLFRQSAADAESAIHMDTARRRDLTDAQLRNAGVEPGDSSLYRNPLDQP